MTIKKFFAAISHCHFMALH